MKCLLHSFSCGVSSLLFGVVLFASTEEGTRKRIGNFQSNETMDTVKQNTDEYMNMCYSFSHSAIQH